MILSIGSARVVSLDLFVPSVGVWFADCELENDTTLPSGNVTITADDLVLQGTVVPTNADSFGGTPHVRVLGGNGGWGDQVTPRGYHSDAGVITRTVAEHVASQVGETVVFSPDTRFGVDFARDAGPASRTLEICAGGTPWWVGYDGITQVGVRETAAVGAKVTVLTYDPKLNTARLGLDKLSQVFVGGIITDSRLTSAKIINELHVKVGDATELDVNVKFGEPNTVSRLAGVIRGMAQRATDSKLFGCYEYRVFNMSGDRVDLQSVDNTAGVPDLLNVEEYPGVPGVHGNLAPGNLVLVTFIAGKRDRPVITGFAGKFSSEHQPVEIELGGGRAPVATQGGTVQMFMPPALAIAGTVAGSPFVGTIAPFPTTLIGQIVTGESNVKAGR